MATSTAEVGDVKVSAEDLIGEGRRHLLCNDAQSACECFGKACEVISEEKGEMADELGPVYVLYGQSLLEIVRLQSSVLGEKLASGEDKSGKASGEGSDNEEEAGGSNGTAAVADTSASSADAEQPEEEAATTADDNAVADPAAAAAGGAEEGDDNDDEEEEQGEGNAEGEAVEDEEDDDRMLAWQILDSARVILSRDSSNKENQYQLVQALKLIGDLSIEKEDFPVAVDDLNAALELCSKLEPGHSRLLAELHFTLGMAHSLSMGTKEAITSYESAIHCLRLNIEKQNQTIEEAQVLDPATKEEVVKKAQTNIDDINELMPDLLSKLEDQRSVAPFSQPTQEGLYQALMSGAATEDDAAGTANALLDAMVACRGQAAVTEAAVSSRMTASSSSEVESVESGFGSSSAGTASSVPKRTMSGQMSRGAAPPVNNIQHLVRKRKADDVDEANSTPEEGGNGKENLSKSSGAEGKDSDATSNVPAAKRIKSTAEPAEGAEGAEP